MNAVTNRYILGLMICEKREIEKSLDYHVKKSMKIPDENIPLRETHHNDIIRLTERYVSVLNQIDTLNNILDKNLVNEEVKIMYKTKNFTCPTGSIVIFATYDLNDKLLVFETAPGYFYPQDSRNTIASINADNFIKQNSKRIESLEEANEFLKSLNIKEVLVKE